MWEHVHTRYVRRVNRLVLRHPSICGLYASQGNGVDLRFVVSKHQTVSEFFSKNTDLSASWTYNWGCSCRLWLRCASRRSSWCFEINSSTISEWRLITPRRRIALDTNTRLERSTCAWVIKTIIDFVMLWLGNNLYIHIKLEIIFG